MEIPYNNEYCDKCGTAVKAYWAAVHLTDFRYLYFCNHCHNETKRLMDSSWLHFPLFKKPAPKPVAPPVPLKVLPPLPPKPLTPPQLP